MASLILVVMLLPAAARAGRQRARLRAGFTNAPIHVDGRLDEPAWRSAGTITNLTEQSPHPSAPNPYRTQVKVLVGPKNVYIGFICSDPNPSKIAIHTMERDGDLRGDDTVAVVLDTFDDHRTGYVFRINVAGARQDGLIAGPEDVSMDWDGIWDARTARTATGWTAEMVIPAETLRFTPGYDTWGFNVERTVARDRTVLRWQGTTLNARFYDFKRDGILLGIGRLEQGKGLSISPWGLIRNDADFQTGHGTVQGDGGLDVTYNLTPDLTGVLTLNTDFAETEVDTRQVNLTRFPLFFPEKRSFFLEGSSLFTFGSGLGHDFIPFFSRRIGLYQGHQVPIVGGVKVLGRTGRWNIGALDTVTGSNSVADGTNLFAGRVTYDLSDHLTVGSILTDGDPDGIHDNALYGIDALWQTSTFDGGKNLSVGGWAARSTGDNPAGRHSGWGLTVDYPNDLWDLYLTVKDFGDGLDPGLGFLPRPGTRWYQGGGAYQPRPHGGMFGWVRQFFFEAFATYVEDLSGHAESWRVFLTPFNVETQSGDHAETNLAPQFERLDAPFEVAPGVIIPPGEYHFTRYRIQLESSPHRLVSVGNTVWLGDFYTGSLTQWETYATYTTPLGHLRIRLSAENDYGHLPQGDFVQRLWQTKVAWALTPDIVLSSYTQYDSESRNLGTNTRFRWTFSPGNDLFVVWNHGWERNPTSPGSLNFRPVSNQFVVKLRWTFRE